MSCEIIKVPQFNMSEKLSTDIHNLIKDLPEDTQISQIIGVLEIVKFDLLESLPVR